MNILRLLPAALIFASLGGCERPTDNVPAVNEQTLQQQAGISADQAVAEMMDSFFDQQLALDPIGAPFLGDYNYNHILGNDLTETFLKSRHDLNTRYLAMAKAVDRSQLGEDRALSLDIFIYDREQALVLETFPERFMPFNQFYSRISSFVQLGSGESAQPFANAKDYRDFLGRVDGFVDWVDSAIARMEEGSESKVVLPRILVERILPQLQAQIVEQPSQSLFYGPINKLPAALSGAERSELTTAYEKAISEQIVPAFVRLHHYMSTVYLNKARASDGYWGLPNGKAWYQALANYHTTTSIPVDEIHQTGLGEVARILQEMDSVRKQVAFDGDLSAFFDHLSSDDRYFFDSEQALVDGYDQIRERINRVVPGYFAVLPVTDYVVKPVEAFRQRSAAGASYEPGSPDGSRPGIFYINSYNLKAQPKWGMTTLSLHEAAPGHHFQISLQQELKGLPKYQQFGGATAFVEGWALYAEYLGIEMGLFSDPYQYFGKLSDEMLRAMRLVVDTGLHAKGWSREQAIQYMLDNSAMAESDVVAEVERYMAIPGQALSYKVGQLKILALREKAERALGDKFDLKGFHHQVLKDGSLPMRLLEQKIDRWIAAHS